MIRKQLLAIRTALILIISVLLVVIVTWFVPSLSAASLNMLFRLRGSFRTPVDIVIVAIDDQSLQRIGQWPWPRSVMAAALDKLTEARPRSVGLDVIYAEPSVPEEDRQLAAAIAHNGRVILPAQLYESLSKGISADRVIAWLRPLPKFADAALAVGHAHVSPDVDGTTHSIQLSKADDQASRLWAFSLEVIRTAENIPTESIDEQARRLRFGSYLIPVRDESTGATIPGVAIIRQNEMLINYAGPTGSFPHYSIADLIDGKIAPSALADKIVLVGAAAESMGDTRIVPFMHYGDGPGQGGQEMPGVEIHANIINTIRNRLLFTSLPAWIDFIVALTVILLSALVIRWFDSWRQVILLGLILLLIVVGSLLAFSRFLIIPPLAPMVTGFFAAIPLLLNRSLTASRELDIKLAALVSSQQGFLTDDLQSGAESIDIQLRLDLPKSLAWKLRAVDDLTTRLLTRMSFTSRILFSMGEGVLVADLAGRIVFVNREAMQLFGCGQAELIGANVADFLIERGRLDSLKLKQLIRDLPNGQSGQLELEIGSAEPRYYSMLLSALGTNGEATDAPPGAQGSLHAGVGRKTASKKRISSHVSTQGASGNQVPAGAAIGVVILISDITKRVELDKMKTETLQLVSHELRTPLTSIQCLSDVLLKFPVIGDESHEMLSTIHAEAVRLGETINRYLDLTRLESGTQSLHLTSIICQDLIAGCIRNLSLLAAERKIRLISQVSPSLPLLHGDTQLLTQAVSNLLSNAIKYGTPNTEILIAAERNSAGLAISVRDQGPGIPKDAQERIFDKFYRLERDTNSNIIGTGLGLPLVKEIIERHGGQVTVESTSDSGSTFKIHLPLQQQALAVARR